MKTTKGHQRSLKVNLCIMVKFVYITFTYITNFIPSSKQVRKASPKVTKGHQKSIHVFNKNCIYKTYVHNSSQLIK